MPIVHARVSKQRYRTAFISCRRGCEKINVAMHNHSVSMFMVHFMWRMPAVECCKQTDVACSMKRTVWFSCAPPSMHCCERCLNAFWSSVRHVPLGRDSQLSFNTRRISHAHCSKPRYYATWFVKPRYAIWPDEVDFHELSARSTSSNILARKPGRQACICCRNGAMIRAPKLFWWRVSYAQPPWGTNFACIGTALTAVLQTAQWLV